MLCREVRISSHLRTHPQAGTRIEARVGSYILVSRDGRIEANGTLFEPIQMTCTAAGKFPGAEVGSSSLAPHASTAARQPAPTRHVVRQSAA